MTNIYALTKHFSFDPNKMMFSKNPGRFSKQRTKNIHENNTKRDHLQFRALL